MAVVVADNITEKNAFGTTDKWLRIDSPRGHDRRRTLYITPSAAAIWSVGLTDGASFDATIAHPLAANVTTAVPVPAGEGRVLVGCTTGAATFAVTVITEDYR